jgi:CheY-specific phosphatase CheX
MSENYRQYSKCLENSIVHIFNNLFNDKSISEIYDSQSSGKAPTVAIEFEGSFHGEILFSLPKKTLKALNKKVNPEIKKMSSSHYNDLAGEIANLVTGTLANQLQYIQHEITLNPPEFDKDIIKLKTFYDTITMSFVSDFGGFDVDLYYKDTIYEG